MKKTIAAIVVVLAIGGAAIWYFLARPTNGASGTAAAAVPANTFFYARSSGDSEFAKSIAALRRVNVQSMQANVDNYRKLAPRYGQAGRFLDGMFEAYLGQLKQGKPVPGLSATPSFVAYAIGIAPVMRVKLVDAAAFKQFLDEAEQRGGAHATAGSFQGVHYREYAIKANEKPTRSALLVAVRSHYAVFTVDAPAFHDETLPLALGLRAPAKTLAKSGLLQRIVKKNGIAADDIAFINHQAIVAALTGAPGSLAGKMLTKLDAKHQLAPLREPACRKDMESIAKVWPITVMGTVPGNATQPGDVAVQERMVSRLTDPSLTKTLSQLRGHIPSVLLKGSAQPMLALALGIDASSLAPVASTLQRRFVQANFQCGWLVKAQREVAQKNPAARTAAAMLISGVRGVSLSIYGFNPGAGTGSMNDLDALVDISATNPRRLFRMAKRMKPRLLGNVQIPSDGSSVLLLPGRNAPPVRAMISGKHLVFFMGPQAKKAAQGLADGKLQPNGVVYYRIDYGELMPVLAKFLSRRQGKQQDAAAMRDLQESMHRMSELKLRIHVLLDFDKDGVVLKAKAAAAKPQPAG